MQVHQIFRTADAGSPQSDFSSFLQRRLGDSVGPLAELLRDAALRPLYQPIASLKSGTPMAHEALIRGPLTSKLHRPVALLKAAAKEDLNFEFETACLVAQIGRWAQLRDPGRLFVNISAAILVQLMRVTGRAALTEYVASLGMLPRKLVFEITEHDRVSDMDRMARVVQDVRAAGVSLALDDFGDGRSSLRLWSQIKPEFVKIDKYFTADLSRDADKLKTIQALQQIAAIFGTELVAEGIEKQEDLRVLRDLGIPYGQGYLLGHPLPSPVTETAPRAMEVMSDRRAAVFPELEKFSRSGHLRRVSVIGAPAASPATTNDELASMFLADEQLHALAVVDREVPLAIINRAHFMNEYSKLYFREVWGRKSCMMHANREPRLIELDHNVDELIGILTSEDQRYLADGFVVTENGRYLGLGTGDHLVRSVTEMRIEAARHANPLTQLPGNVPITQHIERLLNSGSDFIACYADLNDFKPFNDKYGYWRGDEMIRLLARTVLAHCDPQRDFVGHVGGDDFIILFQSPDWQERCASITATLALGALQLFDENARAQGGIHAEDRHGVPRFFPCTTLSVGAAVIQAGQFEKAEDVANQAALAKHYAKSTRMALFVLEGSDSVGQIADIAAKGHAI